MRELLEHLSVKGLRRVATSYNHETSIVGAHKMPRDRLITALEKRGERDPDFRASFRADVKEMRARKPEFFLKKHMGKRVRFAKDEHSHGKALLKLL